MLFRKTEENHSAEKSNSSKHRAAAAAAMLCCVVVMAVCLCICTVQAIVFALKGSSTQGEGDSSSGDSSQATLSATAYGPNVNDAAEISEPVIPYDYNSPVPAIPAAGYAWFADSLFIGDLRMQQLEGSGIVSGAYFLCDADVTVSNAYEHTFTVDGESVVASDLLVSRAFSQIYISLGINQETGWAYSDTFKSEYEALINKISAIQPSAQIYIMGLFPVSDDYGSGLGADMNVKVAEYNTILQQLAAAHKCYFINSAEVFCDENGALIESSCSGGLYPTQEYLDKWYQYLTTHTASKEYYGN